MLNKDITFIYMDSAEKSFMSLLAEEARTRGYKTTVTNDKFASCEIGVYCQHINFPQFSKFSVVMLHDIIQQYGNWPDLWFREPWNKYDIGILPSRQWVKNWNQCSQWKYARPRKGMFLVGWPKADHVANLDKRKYRHDFYRKYGLNLERKTILYAPAWENDNKEDDFVKSVLGLDVNIIIKQWDANPVDYPMQVENVKKMAELHRDIPGVTVLPPSMNIFDAILAADILVSEESSTMSEAAMLGVPAVSVSNWLIPDTIPSRYPECNYDFVTKTQKENLRNCIDDMLLHYSKYKRETERYAENNFSNVGCSCKMILDIIDDCVDGKRIRYEALKPKVNQNVPLKKNIRRLKEQLWREMYANWKERYILFGVTWKFLKGIKDFIKKGERYK